MQIKIRSLSFWHMYMVHLIPLTNLCLILPFKAYYRKLFQTTCTISLLNYRSVNYYGLFRLRLC